MKRWNYEMYHKNTSLTLSKQSFRHCGTLSCAKNSLWFIPVTADCTKDKCTKHITKIAQTLEVWQLLKMWTALRLHHAASPPPPSWLLLNALRFCILPANSIVDDYWWIYSQIKSIWFRLKQRIKLFSFLLGMLMKNKNSRKSH